LQPNRPSKIEEQRISIIANLAMWNYVVTAQKPTAVTHSLVGNFTSSSELNLIVRYAFIKLGISLQQLNTL
jgi:hypothetical protein